MNVSGQILVEIAKKTVWLGTVSNNHNHLNGMFPVTPHIA